MDIKRLADDVAVLLGESLSRECQPEESPFPDLEEKVRITAAGELAELLLAAPAEELTDTIELTGEAVKNEDEKSVTIPLPEDFLRLASIKMTDLPRPLTEVIYAGTTKSSRLGSEWPGVRGIAAEMIVRSGRRYLKIYGSAGEIEYGSYVSRPLLKDDTLEIPEGFYHKLLKRIAFG